MSATSDIARWASDKSFIHDGNLQEVLRQCTSLQIIVISLADSTEEAHRTRPSKLELKHAKHVSFSLQDLINRITSINHVYNLLDRWAIDLFVLGSNKDGSGTNQLKLTQGDDLAGEKSVDVVDTQEECFGEESESVMNLNQPIHKDGAHRPLDLGLVIHVVWVRKHADL